MIKTFLGLGIFGLISGITFFSGIFSAPEPSMTIASQFYGGVINRETIQTVLPGTHCGDESYKPISRAWVEWYYSKKFRPEVSKVVTDWEKSFDCNKFAALFAAKIQLEFVGNDWHSKNPADSAAIGEVWYKGPTSYHAVNVVITENGLEFFDPQNGKWVKLNSEEKKNRSLTKF